MKGFIYLLICCLPSVIFGQVKADDILGQYWTENRTGKIEIYKDQSQYYGMIIWRKEVRKDTENPDEELKSRSVIGIVFLQNFSNTDKNEWSGGEVYSIDNGGTYSGKMWLANDGKTLKMRGYLGISLLGRTATLQRVE
ncbi:MAG: DUF2147 domain-containing protein [Cytophagales bacterium]|nr:DUF2147 domain-containing protein [Cytophagales bacterium]